MKSYDVVIYNYPNKGDRRVLLSPMDINMAHSIVAGCQEANKTNVCNNNYHYTVEETPL